MPGIEPGSSLVPSWGFISESYLSCPEALGASPRASKVKRLALSKETSYLSHFDY